jgi:outer membrane lipoprotein SlyB
MKTVIVSLSALALVATGFVAIPQQADAQSRRERVRVCDDNVRSSANKGTVIGALSGAALGGVVSGNGAKTEGSLLGAGVGAVAGHQIAKKNAKKNCRYVYRDRR